MKHYQMIFFGSVVALFAIPCIAIETLRGVSFFSPRPQGINAARELVGWHPYINRYDANSSYSAYAFTASYTQSVRSKRIARALFGTNILTLSGSLVEDRGEDDILADYFGLSPSFQSRVKLEPLIRNTIVAINVYIGFDSYAPGLYLRFHIPAVWTQWNMNLTEDIFSSGTETPFPAGYMSNAEVIAPVKSFKEAITGGITFGQVQEGITFGTINGAKAKGGIADIECALGWNFILREQGHAGLNIRVIAPTGSRPESIILFEPIVGNGKHWGLGIGFTGRVTIWEKDIDQHLAFYTDVNMLHLFNARQQRSFDFVDNGFASRYVLLKEFDDTGASTGGLFPAINKTTGSCKIKIDVQTDMVFMFSYSYSSILFDIGYSGWIRSKEKVTLQDPLLKNRFGLKGIQNSTDNNTQDSATIVGNNLDEQEIVADPNSPIFLKEQDIDLRSAASPLQLTHKLFVHLSHHWPHTVTDSATGFIGIGGEIEFEGINERNTAQPDKTTAGLWGIWIKGGFAY